MLKARELIPQSAQTESFLDERDTLRVIEAQGLPVHADLLRSILNRRCPPACFWTIPPRHGSATPMSSVSLGPAQQGPFSTAATSSLSEFQLKQLALAVEAHHKLPLVSMLNLRHAPGMPASSTERVASLIGDACGRLLSTWCVLVLLARS
jgi:hypothetical protein